MYKLTIKDKDGRVLELTNSRDVDKPHQAYRLIVNQQAIIGMLSTLAAALEYDCQPEEVRLEIARQAKELLHEILGV